MKTATVTRELSQTPAAIAKRAKREALKLATVTVNPVIEAQTETVSDEIVGFEQHEDTSVVSESIPETAPAAEVMFSATLIDAIKARKTEQVSKDLDYAQNSARRASRAVDVLYAKPEWSGVLDQLATSVKVSDKKSPKFIAVKALVKIVAAIDALASGMRSNLDPYSRTILTNLCTLSGITNKSALVCLSKSVVYDELEAQQALTRHYNCSASTASTQASSTRMMLMHLQVCDVQKGKRADVTQTTETARCAQMLALML